MSRLHIKLSTDDPEHCITEIAAVGSPRDLMAMLAKGVEETAALILAALPDDDVWRASHALTFILTTAIEEAEKNAREMIAQSKEGTE